MCDPQVEKRCSSSLLRSPTTLFSSFTVFASVILNKFPELCSPGQHLPLKCIFLAVAKHLVQPNPFFGVPKLPLIRVTAISSGFRSLPHPLLLAAMNP